MYINHPVKFELNLQLLSHNFELIETVMSKTANELWLLNHMDHYLSQTWIHVYHSSNIFANTSCEITAARIRNDSKYGDEWKLLDKECKFKDVQLISPIFQISIGEDWDHCDHILTIDHNRIIQAYFRHYEVKETELNQSLIDAFDLINEGNNYQLITGVKRSLNYKAKLHYWVPELSIVAK